MESDKLKWSAFAVQTVGALCISFLGSLTGFIVAWPSYTLANFTSNETVLQAPMTPTEQDFLGSLPNLGALIGTPFYGYVFNTLGRKYATVFFGLPFVFAWVIIAMTTNPTIILIAMTLGGIGIGGQNVSLIYISEISHDSIRGGLTACSATGYFFGILISYILGGYLSYYQVVYAHLTLSVLCVVLLLFLKESPVYLVMIGKDEEAAKAIAFYNQVEYTCKSVEVELKKIKLQVDPRFEKLLESENLADIETSITEEFLNNQTSDDVVPKNESPWKMLLRSKSSKKALATVLVLLGASVMMGQLVLQVYAEAIFVRAVPSMSANLSSILLAVDLLLASLVCVLVIDRFGRKNLFIVTALLSGVCTVLLGLQLKFEVTADWVTAFLIYVYSFVYTIGCAAIPFVLAAEVFLPEVRGLCNSITMGSLWVWAFLIMFAFRPLVAALTLGPVFCCFSVVCFFGAAYARYKLPETRGLSADAIQLAFLKM